MRSGNGRGGRRKKRFFNQLIKIKTSNIRMKDNRSELIIYRTFIRTVGIRDRKFDLFVSFKDLQIIGNERGSCMNFHEDDSFPSRVICIISSII